MPTVNYTNVGGNIIAEERGGNRSFYGADPLGSVATIYDSSGNATDAFTYWPYGEVRTFSGSSVTPFEFCGTWGYYREASGRLHVRERHYRDKLCRWTQPDPLWQGSAPYLYADSSPVTLVEPNSRALTSGSEGLELRAFAFVPVLACQTKDPLDEPFTKAMCRALCLEIADANGDGKIGPIERKRIYDPCVLTCERLGAKGVRRVWCKGIESLIDHLIRHPKEGYKQIKNKQLLESLLALWNAMGCPGDPPDIG